MGQKYQNFLVNKVDENFEHSLGHVTNGDFGGSQIVNLRQINLLCNLQYFNYHVGFQKIKERGIYITIEAERGFGYRGDSALDDIKVTNMIFHTLIILFIFGSF